MPTTLTPDMIDITFGKDPQDPSDTYVILRINGLHSHPRLWSTIKAFDRQFRRQYSFSLIGKKPLGLRRRLHVGLRTILLRVAEEDASWVATDLLRYTVEHPPVEREEYNPWKWPAPRCQPDYALVGHEPQLELVVSAMGT